MTDPRRLDVVNIDERRHTEPPPLEGPPPEDDDYRTAAPTRTPRDLAERALLGAMLRDPAARADATQTLTGPDLHNALYEQIWDAIVHLYSRGQPVDTLTVAHHLGNQLPRIGGHAELEQLHYEGLAVIDAGYYADLVAKHAARDRLTAAAQRIQQLTTGDGDLDLDAALAEARNQLDTIQQNIPGVDHQGPTSSYARLDLESVLADIENGTYTGPKASYLARRDGVLLLYPGKVHSISGEPGSAKTWAALIACVQELAEGHPVAFLDFEDDAHAVTARLIALGATPDQIRAHFRYIRPANSFQAGDTTPLDNEVADCTVAIIDGITEAMTINGLSPNDNDDVANWLHLLPNRIADQGPAVLQVDHVVKNAENRGRYAIGGQHKLAGITGAAYKAITVKSFAKGSKGHSKITVDKDKHGDIGPVGITIADLHVDATDPGGAVYAWLDTPEQSHDEAGHFRPTTLMERVSTFLLATPGASSLNEIKRGVKGNNESIADAVDALIREGFIRVEEGPRGSTLHHLVTAFEAEP